MFDTAFAQTATAAAASPPVWQTMLLPLMIIPIFYFLVIRPQQRQAKAHRDMIASVKRGDMVVTAGGILGKVTKVDETDVEVEIAANVRVKVVKGTISSVRAKQEAANDTKN